MSTTADIGANNAVWMGLETTYGTPVDPTASGVGVWMPILDESLVYTETRYYSNQIRQVAMASAAVPAPYHVTGTIHFEVDVNYMPYLLYASRHAVAKTGTGPYTYTVTPTGQGAAYPGGTQRSLSFLIVRNGNGFLYSGCVVSQYSFTLNNGILECTATIMGLAEQDPSGSVSGIETWIDASLFGAGAHSAYWDASGLTPAFSTLSNNVNGFTFDINHNATPQNRINPQRSATFVAYGITEPSLTTELDFLDKSEYNNFKNAVYKAFKLESNIPGGAGSTFAAATQAMRFTLYRASYETYTVDTKGMGDLVTAAVTMRDLAITGGTGYTIECKSPLSIS